MVEKPLKIFVKDGGDKYNGYKMSVILSEHYQYYKFNYDSENPKDFNGSRYLDNSYNSSISGLLMNQDKNGIHIFFE